MRRLALVLCSVLALSAGCDDDETSSNDAAATDGAAGDGSAADVAAPADGKTADASPSADSAIDAAPTDGSAATDGAATDGGIDAAVTDGAGDGGGTDGATDAAPLSPAATRGKYLVGVLGCAGCHTPKVTGTQTPDSTMALAGVDCFVSAPGCLSSANLTPDTQTGLGGLSDQAIVDALRTGKDPSLDAAGKFLSARMPYYQFANLNDGDAAAIVAYLRSLPPVKHAVKAATAPFDQAPTAAEWTAVDPAKLPAPGAGAPADAATGKYFASILCVTCHSPAATGTPKHVDETTAFRGGQSASLASGDAGTIMFHSANLTPDATGLGGWSAMQILTAIRTAKDRVGASLCAPMRANTAINEADATAIADYLMSLPAVSNAVTACSARM